MFRARAPYLSPHGLPIRDMSAPFKVVLLTIVFNLVFLSVLGSRSLYCWGPKGYIHIHIHRYKQTHTHTHIFAHTHTGHIAAYANRHACWCIFFAMSSHSRLHAVQVLASPAATAFAVRARVVRQPEDAVAVWASRLNGAFHFLFGSPGSLCGL